jgi:hypothetical protein
MSLPIKQLYELTDQQVIAFHDEVAAHALDARARA